MKVTIGGICDNQNVAEVRAGVHVDRLTTGEVIAFPVEDVNPGIGRRISLPFSWGDQFARACVYNNGIEEGFCSVTGEGDNGRGRCEQCPFDEEDAPGAG